VSTQDAITDAEIARDKIKAAIEAFEKAGLDSNHLHDAFEHVGHAIEEERPAVKEGK
jgi:hypothetical protein